MLWRPQARTFSPGGRTRSRLQGGTGLVFRQRGPTWSSARRCWRWRIARASPHRPEVLDGKMDFPYADSSTPSKQQAERRDLERRDARHRIRRRDRPRRRPLPADTRVEQAIRAARRGTATCPMKVMAALPAALSEGAGRTTPTSMAPEGLGREMSCRSYCCERTMIAASASGPDRPSHAGGLRLQGSSSFTLLILLRLDASGLLGVLPLTWRTSCRRSVLNTWSPGQPHPRATPTAASSRPSSPTKSDRLAGARWKNGRWSAGASMDAPFSLSPMP